MTILLTWQGSVLCRHRTNGSLVQRPIDHAFDDAEPVELGVSADALQMSFANYLRNDPSLRHELAAGPLRGWILTRSKDARSVNVSQNEQFLSAIHRSDAVQLTPKAQDWEAFLPLGQSEFEALRQTVASGWIVRSTGEYVPPGAVRMQEFFNIAIGSLRVDLRWQVPLDLSAWPNRLTLLRDGWRIDQACRYRPLVYFAAFGNDAIMAQFAHSVRSLVTFGRYDGDIAVLTDHPPAKIAGMLPKFDRPCCTVLQISASDRVSFMSARYSITDWADAWSYQPILYADTDTIFDADITPVLQAITQSDRMSAPFEPMSPLRSWGPVGAGLLQLDGLDPAHLHGFNSGTLGIPNLATHAQTLKLICRIIANNASIKGRDSLPYADQEIANYVSYRIANFDTVLLAAFVRVGGERTSPDHRLGMVHFWGVAGSAKRAEVMGDYLKQLEERG